MKELIEHLCKNHLDTIVSKSLFNCHVIGLHSIMLLDSPEQRIRLYYADYNHELYHNDTPKNDIIPKLSLGFHAHHCNLTLQCAKGKFRNQEIVIDFKNHSKFNLDEYKYKSKILENETSFEFIKTVGIHYSGIKQLHEKDTIYMLANQIHNIYVEKECSAAWLVYEGKEWDAYDSVLYTNNDPNLNDTSKLYQPITKDKVKEILYNIFGIREFSYNQ